MALLVLEWLFSGQYPQVEPEVSSTLTPSRRFPYTDTTKLLRKIHGFKCQLYDALDPSDMGRLENDLKDGMQIQALFTEFPGNPLCYSVDLDRLYRLAGTYGFITVVDDSVGSPVNLNILSSCDVVCTSLTKMFSGGCNVMGGSVVVNPESSYFGRLQDELTIQFTDAYFPLDMEVMEANSRDVEARVVRASDNAERMAELISGHRIVSNVYYPKRCETRRYYERYKRPGKGYGHLLTVLFSSPSRAIAFHDALRVAKGPSFGTNFTLCTAHTLYSHYRELEWAAQYGVTEHLVRISVGVEDWTVLERAVREALDVASRIRARD